MNFAKIHWQLYSTPVFAGDADERAGVLARARDARRVRGPVHRQVVAGAQPQRLQDVRPPAHLAVQLRGHRSGAQPGLRLPGDMVLTCLVTYNFTLLTHV